MRRYGWGWGEEWGRGRSEIRVRGPSQIRVGWGETGWDVMGRMKCYVAHEIVQYARVREEKRREGWDEIGDGERQRLDGAR